MKVDKFREFLEEIKKECILHEDCGACNYERFCFEVENKFPQTWAIEKIIENEFD